MKAQFQVLSIILLSIVLLTMIYSLQQKFFEYVDFFKKNDIVLDFITLYKLKELYSRYYKYPEFLFAVPVKIYYMDNYSMFILSKNIQDLNISCSQIELDCRENKTHLVIGTNKSIDIIYFYSSANHSTIRKSGIYVTGVFLFSAFPSEWTFYTNITTLFSKYYLSSYYNHLIASSDKILITS